jgi:hypothetical protein
MRLPFLVSLGFLPLGFFAPGARAQGPGEAQREVVDLFHAVEKDLEEIDRLLLEAASEPSSSEDPRTSDDKAAARDANGKQKRVIESIQRILELIPKTGSGSGGGSGQRPEGSPPPPSGSEGNQPQGNSPRERERTPEGAQKAPTQREPSSPDDPRKSPADPHKGTRPAVNHPTERNPNAGGAFDRWGDLPDHARDAFRNDRTDDLPLRYRRWIEDFYRRVQKSEPNGR